MNTSLLYFMQKSLELKKSIIIKRKGNDHNWQFEVILKFRQFSTGDTTASIYNRKENKECQRLNLDVVYFEVEWEQVEILN